MAKTRPSVQKRINELRKLEKAQDKAARRAARQAARQARADGTDEALTEADAVSPVT